MKSIAQSVGENLEQHQRGPVTTFRYGLRVTPDDVYQMTREQLIALVFEQATVLSVICAIVYNTHAGLATRLIAIDLLFENVERTIRHSIETVLERRPVLYSGVVKDSGTGKRVGTGRVGVAERLGVSAGTVSASYGTLEGSGLVNLYHRTSDDGHKHIDVEMQETFLTRPTAIQDKKEQRAEPAPKTAVKCPVCGSYNVDLYHSYLCHTCHEVSNVEIHTSEYPIEFSSSENHHDAIVSSSVEAIPEPGPEGVSTEREPAADGYGNEGLAALSSSPSVAEEVLLQSLALLLQGYEVEYRPHMTCVCGCKLWRPIFGGQEWECCRCEPSPLWPERFNQVLRRVWPELHRAKQCGVPVGASPGSGWGGERL